MKKKKVKENRLVIKMILCLFYLIVITILLVCSYKLYKEKQEIKSFSNVETLDDYTYIDVYKMSEKFAYFKDTNIGIHFVIEKENTGRWHTYVVAINEDRISDFKDIIDYTYERTERIPDTVRIYGYPKITKDKIKELAIKNIKSFVPKENEVVITKDNYDNYLTNTYLDTTQEKKDDFNVILFITLLLLLLVIVLFVLTIMDRDKIVDDIEKDLKKTKKLLKRHLK